MRLLRIFSINVFLSLAYAATVFINSSFLSSFFSPLGVSTIFVVASVAVIALIFALPSVITKIHIQGLLLTLMFGTALTFLGMYLSHQPLVVALLFIINSCLLFFSYYCLDILLEAVTTDNETGSIRGIFLTLSNSAIAVAPLFLTVFIQGDSVSSAYWIATLLLVPPIILLARTRQPLQLKQGHLNITHRLPLASWATHKSVRRATLARLVLESFYGFMTIYTPIYLHQVVGFSWQEIGIIFTIMLIPFILFEWPAGILGDKFIGEKEIMNTGFIIAGTATLIMIFIGHNFALWTIILFVSRIGASLIEISTESHFFKHVSSKDFSYIAIFRLSRPVGVLLGTVLGAISIAVMPFNFIFLSLGCLVLLGLTQSAVLKDTR